jgi:hypothetical protein
VRLMGHSTVAVPQLYVYPSHEALESAMERMEQANRPKVPQIRTTVDQAVSVRNQ